MFFSKFLHVQFLLVLLAWFGAAVPRHFPHVMEDGQAEEEMMVMMREMREEEEKKATKVEKEKEARCPLFAQCYGDEQCGSNGKCTGINSGTCDCWKCLKGADCSLGAGLGQPECGGLKGACKNGKCDCEAGYRQLGFVDEKEATAKFCFKKKCTSKENDQCGGLPCFPGTCTCAFGLQSNLGGK